MTELPLRHLRSREDGVEQRATALELFFDLVFVFAITQISHYLMDHLDAVGFLRSTFLLLVVWWAWTYTTWMANWFDPHGSKPVRVALMVVMGFGLPMSIGLPGAFDKTPLLFAGSYAALQIFRNAFNIWAVPRSAGDWRLSLERIFWWSIATGAVWVAGVLVGGRWLVPIWVVALVIDYLGPYAGYWTPGLGRAATTDWTIDPYHFSERFSLLVIIALGEGIVVTGATAYKVDLGPEQIAGIIVAFMIAAEMWWLYFNFVAARATERLAAAEDPGRLARDAYTYLHLPIVMGIIVTAVADAQLIAHPNDPYVVPVLAVAGPVLYLVGHNLFRLSMARSISIGRLFATFLLIALLPLAETAGALVVSVLVVAILFGLIIREELIVVAPLEPASVDDLGAVV